MKEAPGGLEASLCSTSALQCVSGHPFLCLKGDVHERLQVAETERGAVAPGAGLILERPGEGRCEERPLLADVLPDRGLDVATSQRGRRSFGLLVGRHLVSSLCEMKVILSREEERHRTVHRGNRRQRPKPADRRGPRSESDGSQARTMRLAGESRSAVAGGDQSH